jgi:hypothetical protein
MIKGQEKLDSATKHKPAFMFDGAAYTKHHRDPRRRGSRDIFTSPSSRRALLDSLELLISDVLSVEVVSK